MNRIHVTDSHTAGEPTRIVLAGGPDLGAGSLAERVKTFREKHDAFRSAVCNEPRGSEALVGGLLVPATNPKAAAAVIFFNNVGYLGMCGHGTIGLVATLAHHGRIRPGSHVIETPVGEVVAELSATGDVSVANVPSYRTCKAVPVRVEVDGQERVLHGDVAWGGNWFFLCGGHGQELRIANLDRLNSLTRAIRSSLQREGITGQGGAEIDHVELTGKAADPANHGRNFVMCPGGAYDRSPCGTGTSAKLACLAADGVLAQGAIWRQESVLGTVFSASFAALPGEGQRIAPTIAGRAYVTAEATLMIDERDPLAMGIRV